MDFTEGETIEFLRGSILGDMCIEKNSGSIINTQSIIHSDYVNLKYEINERLFNLEFRGIIILAKFNQPI